MQLAQTDVNRGEKKNNSSIEKMGIISEDPLKSFSNFSCIIIISQIEIIVGDLATGN